VVVGELAEHFQPQLVSSCALRQLWAAFTARLVEQETISHVGLLIPPQFLRSATPVHPEVCTWQQLGGWLVDFSTT
jgi:hypothetical protein